MFEFQLAYHLKMDPILISDDSVSQILYEIVGTELANHSLDFESLRILYSIDKDKVLNVLSELLDVEFSSSKAHNAWGREFQQLFESIWTTISIEYDRLEYIGHMLFNPSKNSPLNPDNVRMYILRKYRPIYSRNIVNCGKFSCFYTRPLDQEQHFIVLTTYSAGLHRKIIKQIRAICSMHRYLVSDVHHIDPNQHVLICSASSGDKVNELIEEFANSLGSV